MKEDRDLHWTPIGSGDFAVSISRSHDRGTRKMNQMHVMVRGIPSQPVSDFLHALKGEIPSTIGWRRAKVSVGEPRVIDNGVGSMAISLPDDTLFFNKKKLMERLRDRVDASAKELAGDYSSVGKPEGVTSAVDVEAVASTLQPTPQIEVAGIRAFCEDLARTETPDPRTQKITVVEELLKDKNVDHAALAGQIVDALERFQNENKSPVQKLADSIMALKPESQTPEDWVAAAERSFRRRIRTDRRDSGAETEIG